MSSFQVILAEQRSPAWRAARAGRATGSKAGDILATMKSGGEAAARRDYRYQLVAERLTGEPQESDFTNAAMQWGVEQEPFARMAYEAATGLSVRETGFLAHQELMIGCSLDGDVEDFAGIVEIKCPKTVTHLSYITAGVVPGQYLPQIAHNLLVSGAEWCDFVSFDPRLPDELRLFVARIDRAAAGVESYQEQLHKFLREVDDLEQSIRNLRRTA